MGVNPTIWGPYAWAALHLICEGAPMSINGDMRKHYRAFFAHLAHVLPCEKCAEHLQEILERHPIGNDILTRDHLIDWCIILHNEVTKNVPGGSDKLMAMDAARQHWKLVSMDKKPAFPSVCTHCGRKNENKSKLSWLWFGIVFGLGVSIGIGSCYCKKSKNK